MQVPIVRDHDQRNHGDNLEILKLNPNYKVVDMTGGAPEMNQILDGLSRKLVLGIQMYVRCNLTIITANKKYNDLPEFFKKHNEK
jgi:hypothetical protein